MAYRKLAFLIVQYLLWSLPCIFFAMNASVSSLLHAPLSSALLPLSSKLKTAYFLSTGWHILCGPTGSGHVHHVWICDRIPAVLWRCSCFVFHPRNQHGQPLQAHDRKRQRHSVHGHQPSLGSFFHGVVHGPNVAIAAQHLRCCALEELFASRAFTVRCNCSQPSTP